MLGKAIIYQVLPRLWNTSREGALKAGGSLVENGSGHFSSIDGKVLAYLHDTLNVSHVWYTGVIRHAGGCNDWAKGEAGSPYAIEDYFDVNPYLSDNEESRLDEFKLLIKRTHAAGMKVVLDFVPNHLARSCSAFFGSADDVSVHWKPENDFFYYPGEELRLPMETAYREFPAKASGNAFTPCPAETDWYDTVKLNYCDFRTPTWDKMLEVLRFWCAMGVDAFRCDMVELVPREAIAFLVREVKKEYPDTQFIAEVYDRAGYAWYSSVFDALYDKCGLYDTLFSIVRHNVGAAPYAGTEGISANWQFLGPLQPSMLNFLENHDELRLASDFFAGSAKASFAALYVSLLLNTAPFMLYFGQEAGERGMDAEGFSGLNGRTSIFDWWCPKSIRDLDTFIHTGKGLSREEAAVLKKYSALLAYSREDVIRHGGMYDLQYCNKGAEGYDCHRHYAFLRAYKGEVHLIAANFSSKEARVCIRVPAEALHWAGAAEPEDMEVHMTIPACDGNIKKLLFL